MMMNSLYRFLIADDHTMFAEGLKNILENNPEYSVVKVASNGEEVLDFLASNKVDFAILDVRMPVMDGITTTKIIKNKYPEIKVLVLSMYNRSGFIKNAINSGVDGYILKNLASEELITAIKTLQNGEQYFSQKVTKTLINQFKNDDSQPVINLSAKELKILKLLAEGFTSFEIGEQLSISHHTVNTHRKNILFKFNVKNVTHLVHEAYKQGYLIDSENDY